jgi:exodeoxyribonuclease-5
MPAVLSAATQLTPEQQGVFDGVCQRCNGSRDQTVTIVDGGAGTGKSTLAARIMLAFPGALVCTPTGKSADVLRRKSGMPVKTIHSTIYRLLDAEEMEGRPTRLRFEPRYADGALRGRHIIVDESSMVDERMAEDMLRTGAHITTFGDPFQLPPVNGKRYFDPADFSLHEIHRQALKSGITRQAYEALKQGHYASDRPEFIVIDDINDRHLFEADAILCHTNATRGKLNRRMRVLHGKSGHPQRGEPVLCFKNAPKFNIFNGGVYALSAPFEPLARSIHLEVDGKAVEIPFVSFAGEPLIHKPLKGFISHFDFGYGLTVHKAQGSEWRHVLVVDNYRPSDFRNEWLYTAITRGAEKLTILR